MIFNKNIFAAQERLSLTSLGPFLVFYALLLAAIVIVGAGVVIVVC